MELDFTRLAIQAGNIVLLIAGVFYSIILHEIAHGYSAYRFGDDTAKRAKRLSLNPIPHIDIIGTIILPIGLFIMGLPLFGWAKPVPVNPNNFTKGNPRKAFAVVSLAGVAVNFILIIIMFSISSIMLKFPYFSEVLMQESSRILDSPVFPSPIVFFQIAGINIMLMVFNLLPFPPLDGYNFLVSVLPNKTAFRLEKNRTTLMICFLVLLVTGLFRYIYMPIFNGIFWIFGKIFGFL
jgi:Zn-dependent protease